MKDADRYIDINRIAWNNKVESHIKSKFYDMERFMKGASSLNEIEMQLLGNLAGKTVLHLQCHFGQDTISMSRLGARAVGVDLSDIAIDEARKIAETDKANASFICCDLYELEKHCNETFDLVFTSYGAIPWLPDLNRWAHLIAKFLKPGGEFIMAEFHPVVWMFNDQFNKIAFDYFNTGAIVETESGTYADRNADLTATTVAWNHSLSEVINNLIRHGLEIVLFNEYDYSPYNCFQNTIQFEQNKYRIAHLENKIPMVYSLKAVKKI